MNILHPLNALVQQINLTACHYRMSGEYSQVRRMPARDGEAGAGPQVMRRGGSLARRPFAPYVRMVGVEGFEPPAPCSQSRCVPALLLALRGIYFQWCLSWCLGCAFTVADYDTVKRRVRSPSNDFRSACPSLALPSTCYCLALGIGYLTLAAVLNSEAADLKRSWQSAKGTSVRWCDLAI